MNLVKNVLEIAKITIAAKVVGKILSHLKTLTVPGNNGLLLAKTAHSIMREHGCVPNFLNYHGFPDVICISINNQLLHGIPNDYSFRHGDLVSIDVGCQYEGYHADAAITVVVKQFKNLSDQKLLKTTKNALNTVIKMIKPGMTVGDIGCLIEQIAYQNNYQVPLNYAGHGIGQNLHEEPVIFNYGKPCTGTILQTGMVICVEPMFLQGGNETTTLDDN